MTNQREISTIQRNRAFGLIAVIVAGFALCLAMKAFVCGKFGDSCPCQETSGQEDCGDQDDCGCSSSEGEK